MSTPPPEAPRFSEVFPVPDTPVDVRGAGGWERVEETLSLRLPGDYKWFIERYGTGCVSAFLWIFNPFTTNENLDLVRQVASLSEQYRRMKRELGEEEVPFPLYPEEGGLVPFGVSDNGDVFFWLTDSTDPREWNVVGNETRSSTYEVHERTMTAFLLGVVTGETESRIFEAECIDSDRLFLSFDEVE